MGTVYNPTRANERVYPLVGTHNAAFCAPPAHITGPTVRKRARPAGEAPAQHNGSAVPHSFRTGKHGHTWVAAGPGDHAGGTVICSSSTHPGLTNRIRPIRLRSTPQSLVHVTPLAQKMSFAGRQQFQVYRSSPQESHRDGHLREVQCSAIRKSKNCKQNAPARATRSARQCKRHNAHLAVQKQAPVWHKWPRAH
uniref:Uncharacterized protein n=1 Tax=Trypanosoma vivax (strain Y486) TaxID=1055687 RepID=G0TR54_TRYVY|nr:hypothetical protein, unlikely [Trypanosoma vivax Y486]